MQVTGNPTKTSSTIRASIIPFVEKSKGKGIPGLVSSAAKQSHQGSGSLPLISSTPCHHAWCCLFLRLGPHFGPSFLLGAIHPSPVIICRGEKESMPCIHIKEQSTSSQKFLPVFPLSLRTACPAQT